MEWIDLVLIASLCTSAAAIGISVVNLVALRRAAREQRLIDGRIERLRIRLEVD